MSNEDLKRVAEYLRAKGATATMVNLKKSPDEPDARVLFIKNGINWIGADREKVFDEMRSLGKDGMDTRYYNSRRKMVQNKLARWNFNAGDRHQDADIPNGKNTLYHFDELPELGKIRQGINKMADQLKMPHLNGLLAEANVYYNDTCGIRYTVTMSVLRVLLSDAIWEKIDLFAFVLFSSIVFMEMNSR